MYYNSIFNKLSILNGAQKMQRGYYTHGALYRKISLQIPYLLAFRLIAENT